MASRLCSHPLKPLIKTVTFLTKVGTWAEGVSSHFSGFSILTVRCVQLWRSQGTQRNGHMKESQPIQLEHGLQTVNSRCCILHIYPRRFWVVAGKLLQAQRRQAECSDGTCGDRERDL